MKYVTRLAAAFVSWGLMAGSVWAQPSPVPLAPPAPPALPAAAVQPASGDVQAAIDQINNAKDTSQVIDAYSRVMDAAPNNVALMQAYIHKLVELDVPQFAAPVAEKLVKIAPDDAQAWAVLGVAEAKKGNMPDALSDVVFAVLRSPDDPFIQKTAGQMIAWYDNAPQKPALADTTKAQIERVRQLMFNHDAYTTAYKQAGDFYTQQSQQANANANANTNPNTINTAGKSTPMPQGPAPQPYYTYGSGTPVDSGSYYQSPYATYYASPYVTSGYYDSYYYPGYAYPSYYYGYYPYYPGIYIGGGFFGHSHDGGFRGGFRGGFNGGGHFEGAANGGHIGGGGHVGGGGGRR